MPPPLSLPLGRCHSSSVSATDRPAPGTPASRLRAPLRRAKARSRLDARRREHRSSPTRARPAKAIGLPLARPRSAAAGGVPGRFRAAARLAREPMEPNLFKYIWRHSKREQIFILLLVLLSLPFYFLSR